MLTQGALFSVYSLCMLFYPNSQHLDEWQFHQLFFKCPGYSTKFAFSCTVGERSLNFGLYQSQLVSIHIVTIVSEGDLC